MLKASGGGLVEWGPEITLDLVSNPLAAIPYEPWSITGIDFSTFALTDGEVWCLQFTAPCNAIYDSVTILTAHNSGSSVDGTIGVGIFDDIPGNPGDPDGPTPKSQGQYTFVSDNLHPRQMELT